MCPSLSIPNLLLLHFNSLFKHSPYQPVRFHLFSMLGFDFFSLLSALSAPSIQPDEEQLHVISAMHTDADIYFWIRCFFGFLLFSGCCWLLPLLLLLHLQISLRRAHHPSWSMWRHQMVFTTSGALLPLSLLYDIRGIGKKVSSRAFVECCVMMEFA